MENNLSTRHLANTTASIAGDGFRKLEFISEKPEVAIPSIVLISLAGILGTFGNGLILVAIAKSHTLRSVECILIVNLAFSDLFVTIIADPMSIIAKIEGEDFFGRIPGLCRTIGSLCTISCGSSLLTITAMCLNRYFLICHHRIYKKIFTKRGCVLLCLSFYVIGMAIVLLNVAGIGNHGFNRSSLECVWDRMVTYPYTVVVSVVFVLIPITLTGALYLRIYCFVQKSQNRVKINRGNSETKSQMYNLAKSLFIIYAVFAVCWVPYAILIVADDEDTFSHATHVYITTLAHLHPSFNWIVYYFTNKKFTASFDTLIPFKKCKRHKELSMTSVNTVEQIITDNSNNTLDSINLKSDELIPLH